MKERLTLKMDAERITSHHSHPKLDLNINARNPMVNRKEECLAVIQELAPFVELYGFRSTFDYVFWTSMESLGTLGNVFGTSKESPGMLHNYVSPPPPSQAFPNILFQRRISSAFGEVFGMSTESPCT
ncbi:unnamed protein product [Heligmosomoides polygyrus]|uniref:Cytochrome P450 n=1 Tax=Heligmosomoides polygyrus TaxID=6339 RepID=A0A183GB32_HELPZ|nr:unnamed protein product [Heligmosomoides polygyrus]